MSSSSSASSPASARSALSAFCCSPHHFFWAAAAAAAGSCLDLSAAACSSVRRRFSAYSQYSNGVHEIEAIRDMRCCLQKAQILNKNTSSGIRRSCKSTVATLCEKACLPSCRLENQLHSNTSHELLMTGSTHCHTKRTMNQQSLALCDSHAPWCCNTK